MCIGRIDYTGLGPVGWSLYIFGSILKNARLQRWVFANEGRRGGSNVSRFHQNH